MAPIVAFIRDALRFHKLKISSIFVFAAFFSLWIFPYNDLGNLLTTKIYEGSGQQIYFSADNLELALFPVPGIAATGVTVEPGPRGQRFAPLKMVEVELRPLLSAILAFHGGASVDASGFFGGVLSLAVSTSNSIFSKDPGAIELKSFELNGITLTEIMDYVGEMMAAPLQLKIGGKLSALSNGMTIDPTFKTPIKGDLGISVANLSLPTQIPLTGFGALDIPLIKIPKAEFQTQWGGNKVNITKGSFGTDKDPMSGRLLGNVELRHSPAGGVNGGVYNICIEFSFTDAFYTDLQKKIPLLEGFKTVTEKYRQQGGTGVRYSMIYSGPDFAQIFTTVPRPGSCDKIPGA